MKDEICKAYVTAAIGEIERQNNLLPPVRHIKVSGESLSRLIEMQAVAVASAIAKALETRPVARGFKGK